MKASISTCRKGAVAIVCSAFAIEPLPTLPTPLRRTIRAVVFKAHPSKSCVTISAPAAPSTLPHRVWAHNLASVRP